MSSLTSVAGISEFSWAVISMMISLWADHFMLCFRTHCIPTSRGCQCWNEQAISTWLGLRQTSMPTLLSMPTFLSMLHYIYTLYVPCNAHAFASRAHWGQTHLPVLPQLETGTTTWAGTKYAYDDSTVCFLHPPHEFLWFMDWPAINCPKRGLSPSSPDFDGSN
jgi:hypothetical protein